MAEKDPDMLVDLTTVASDFEAQTIRQRLESEGVPAFAATTAGIALAWDIAVLQPMRVQVRRKDLATAQHLLDEFRSEAGSTDWDSEDVGPPDPDEPAAAGPATPDWKERNDARRTIGLTLVWLPNMFLFVLLALPMLVAGKIRRLWKKTSGAD